LSIHAFSAFFSPVIFALTTIWLRDSRAEEGAAPQCIVATVSRGAGVLVVNPSVPATSVPQLIAYANANPAKVTVASAGVGSAPHIFGRFHWACPAATRCKCAIAAAGSASALFDGQVTA
jgi:hypothetical protein